MTAALFSAAHVPPDVPTFLDRFAFGLAASAVVWLTGGLEAAIVLHAVNNVLVFVLAGALGDGVGTQSYPGGVGPPSCCWSACCRLAGYVAAGGALADGSAPRRTPRRWTCGRRAAAGRSPPADPPTGVGGDRPRAVGYRLLRRREVPPMGYGVIGSPTVSGSVSLGSSPGTPARKHRFLSSTQHARPRRLAAQDAALSRR